MGQAERPRGEGANKSIRRGGRFNLLTASTKPYDFFEFNDLVANACLTLNSQQITLNRQLPYTHSGSNARRGLLWIQEALML